MLVYSKIIMWCRGPDLNQRQLGLQLHPQQLLQLSRVLSQTELPRHPSEHDHNLFFKVFEKDVQVKRKLLTTAITWLIVLGSEERNG